MKTTKTAEEMKGTRRGIAVEPEARPAKERFRIMRHVGHSRWELREGPGWKVVHHAPELETVLDHVERNGIAPESVVLVTSGKWITLAEHRAFQEQFDRQHGGED